MTRLYVSVRCERCGSYHGVDCGPCFGRQLGDEPISRGLCMSCEFEMMKMLKEKGVAETMTGIAIPCAGTVKRALREYINELEYRVETHTEDAEKAGKELECAEKALAALSGKPFGEEKVKELFEAAKDSPSMRLAVALTAWHLGYTIPGAEPLLQKAGVLAPSEGEAAS